MLLSWTSRLLTMLGLCCAMSGIASAQPTSRPSASTSNETPRLAVTGRPAWSELTSVQRKALAPLARSWEQLSEEQKRKWIALAANFSRMSPTEQATLQRRMSGWVALSPQQRTQARLNFGETQQLSADEKKAKWEAYQALPAETKSKLAASAAARTPDTAAAVKPVPAQKLATVPRQARNDAKPARILVAPPADATSHTY